MKKKTRNNLRIAGVLIIAAATILVVGVLSGTLVLEELALMLQPLAFVKVAPDGVTDRSRLTCNFGMTLFALKRKIRPLIANAKTSNANMREITPKGVNYFLLI